MQLLYMVPWANRFVHENKSISFYQPFPVGIFADFVNGGGEKQNWGRHMPTRTPWLLESPPLVPSPFYSVVVDLLVYPWPSPVPELWGLRVDSRCGGLGMVQ